jgi:hypothetical protein
MCVPTDKVKMKEENRNVEFRWKDEKIRGEKEEEERERVKNQIGK